MRKIACRLIAGRFRDMVAFGAGWTDQERQQPVPEVDGPSRGRPTCSPPPSSSVRSPIRTGSTGSHSFVTRWAAAFVIDPDGATRTTALGARARRDGSARRCATAIARYAPDLDADPA